METAEATAFEKSGIKLEREIRVSKSQGKLFSLDKARNYKQQKEFVNFSQLD
jgi:hypothetical protein